MESPTEPRGTPENDSDADDESLTIEVEETRDALKVAKHYFDKDEFDIAIAVLRKAYPAMEDAEDPPELDDYLQLPKYMLAANYRDEAWGEYNRLLGAWRDNPDVLPMAHSKIYSRMTTQLLQEKKYKAAIRFAAMSHFQWLTGLHKQERFVELERELTLATIMGKYRRFPKSVKDKVGMNGVYDIFEKYANKLPHVKMRDMVRELDKIMRGLKV